MKITAGATGGSAGWPQGAVDTHVHVFDPDRFPYGSDRAYTPGAAPVQALQSFLSAHGLTRVVLVQPSVYGTDNRCLLAALAALGTDVARGVAVADLERWDPDEADAWYQAGIRGLRLNLKVLPGTDVVQVRRALLRAAHVVDRPGWCVQVHGPAALWPLLADTLPNFRVPVVLDHFAGRPQPGAPMALLLELLRSGRVYVKLSAPYRCADTGPGYRDLAPLAQALLGERVDRVLWGSDWPHTGGDGVRTTPAAALEPFRQVDVGALLLALQCWCGGPGPLRHVLVDNPARLYGWPSPLV